MYYVRAVRDRALGVANAATATAYTLGNTVYATAMEGVEITANAAHTLGSAIADSTYITAARAVEAATSTGHSVVSTLATALTSLVTDEFYPQTLEQIEELTPYVNGLHDVLTKRMSIAPTVNLDTEPNPPQIIEFIQILPQPELGEIHDLENDITTQKALFEARIRALLHEITTHPERLTSAQLEILQERSTLLKNDIRLVYADKMRALTILSTIKANQIITIAHENMTHTNGTCWAILNNTMPYIVGNTDQKGDVEEKDTKYALEEHPIVNSTTSNTYYNDEKVREFLKNRLLETIKSFADSTKIEIDISEDLKLDIPPEELIIRIEEDIRQALHFQMQAYEGEFSNLIKDINIVISQDPSDNILDIFNARTEILDRFYEKLESLQILSERYNTALYEAVRTFRNIEQEMTLVAKLEIYDRLYVPKIAAIEDFQETIQSNSIEINQKLATIFQAIEFHTIDKKISKLRQLFSRYCQNNEYNINIDKSRNELCQHLEAIKKLYFEDLMNKIMLAITSDVGRRLQIYEIPLEDLERVINLKVTRIFDHIEMALAKQVLLIEKLKEYYERKGTTFSGKDFEDFTVANPIVTHEELRQLSQNLTVDIPGEELSSPVRPSLSKVEVQEGSAIDPALEEEIRIKSWRTTVFFTTVTAAAVVGTLVFGPAVCVATAIISAGMLKRYENDILPPPLPERSVADLPGHKSKFDFVPTPAEEKLIKQNMQRAERKAKEKYNKENRDAATEAIGTGFGSVIATIAYSAAPIISPPGAIIVAGVATFLTRICARYIPDEHLLPLGKKIIDMRFKLTELTTGTPEEIRKNRRELEIPANPTDSLARRKLQDQAISFISNVVTGGLFILGGASSFITGGAITPVLIATGTAFFVTRGIGRAWTFCTTPVDSVASLAPGAKTLNNMSFLSTEFADVYKEAGLLAAAALIPNKAAKAALAGTSGLIIAARICDISTLMKMTVPWELRLANIKGMRATDKLSIALKYGTIIFGIIAIAAYTGVSIGVPDYKISFSDIQSSTLISGVLAGAWAATCGVTYMFSDKVIKAVVFFDRIFGNGIHKVMHAICNCKKLDAKLGVSSFLNKHGLLHTKQREDIPFEQRELNVAKILIDLCSKDPRYKSILSEELDLDVKAHWNANLLIASINKKLVDKKDTPDLEKLLSSIDKRLQKKAPNSEAGYPLKIYESQEIAPIDPTYITLTSNWHRTADPAVSRILNIQRHQGHGTAILEGDKPEDLARLEEQQRSLIKARRVKSVKAGAPAGVLLARRPSETSSEPDSVGSGTAEVLVDMPTSPQSRSGTGIRGSSSKGREHNRSTSPLPSWAEKVRPGSHLARDGAEESKHADRVTRSRSEQALARAETGLTAGDVAINMAAGLAM